MKKRTKYQLFSLVALHASLGSAWLPTLKRVCNPVLSCHSCALAWFACPIGVFVHYSGYQLFPWIAVGMTLVLGALIGRLLCGWVCPFGFLQDLLFKIPSKKFSLPKWMLTIKYLVLLFMVILIPYFLGESTLFSFCRICPAAALQSSLPVMIQRGFEGWGTAHTVRFAILGLILIGAVIDERSFCKVLCPIGAMLAPLNFISAWTVRTPRDTCLTCQKCDDACGMDVNPSPVLGADLPANRALECIVCHDCQDACEDVTQKVLAAKTRRENSERRKRNIPVGNEKRSPDDRRAKQVEPPSPS